MTIDPVYWGPLAGMAVVLLLMAAWLLFSLLMLVMTVLDWLAPVLSKARTLFGRLRPVRGNTWWELQAGPVVFQVRHRTPAIERAKLVGCFWDAGWLL